MFDFPGIVPRADGRISVAQAAEVAKVDEKTIYRWVSEDALKDVKREGRRIWLQPGEVIQVEWDKHGAERKRIERLMGGRPAEYAVA